MSLGDRLLEARKRRGLTQAQVAKAVSAGRPRGEPETKASTISQYESNKRTPSIPMLERLAEALGLSPASFWPESGDTERQVSEPVAGAARLVRSFVAADGAIDGEAGAIGATGLSAQLAKALATGAGRRGAPDEHRWVRVPDAPIGTVLAELADPLSIWAGKRQLALWPKGWILVIDPDAKPQDQELELVVAKNDRGLEDDVDPMSEEAGGKTFVMRYKVDSDGAELLYTLDGKTAYTTAQGWEVVAVVRGEPRKPRT